MAGEFSDGELDLFGFAIVPARGPGRPPHVPTAETRQFVNMMFVCGHEPKAVWQALGLRKTAFYEHYRAELIERQLAAVKFRFRQMLRLNTQADGGNVAAEKALAGMIEREQVKTLAGQVIGRAQAAHAKDKAQPKLGKKEEAKNAAGALEGKFATRSAPPGMVG